MKHSFSRLKAVLMLVFTSFVLPLAQAQTPSSGFAGQGTLYSTNVSYFTVTAKGAADPRIEFISATSDTAAGKITFYLPTVSSLITNASAGATNGIWCSTNGFAANDIAVLRHVAADTYDRAVISAVGASITLASASASAVAAGDILYRVASQGTIPVGSATLTINAGAAGIFNGRRYNPILVEVNGIGTNTISLNVASGEFR